MRIQKYLVISALRGRYGGFTPKVELKEREPKLEGNEVAVSLSIEVPDAFFKRPTLEATLSIPEAAVPALRIHPSTIENTERLIRDATGLTMKVSLVPQEKPYPQDIPDVVDMTGDFSNLQKFKVGQQVRFYIENPDDRYAGVHVVQEIRKEEVGHTIRTDRSGNQFIHVHWFAPIRKK